MIEFVEKDPVGVFVDQALGAVAAIAQLTDGAKVAFGLGADNLYVACRQRSAPERESWIEKANGFSICDVIFSEGAGTQHAFLAQSGVGVYA
jgi:DNA-binding phage protein